MNTKNHETMVDLDALHHELMERITPEAIVDVYNMGLIPKWWAEEKLFELSLMGKELTVEGN